MNRLKFRKTTVPNDIDKFSQLDKEINSSGNSHFHSNIRYSLRSRDIHDNSGCENQDTHTSREVETPPLKISTKITENNLYQSRYFLANSVLKDDKLSQGDRPQTTVNKLPNEMLTMIFSYLTIYEISSSVALVCKRWYIISKSPVLWRSLVFVDDDVTTQDAKKLLSKAPLLREIRISYRFDAEELLAQLCSTNRNVQIVSIKRCADSRLENCWDWTLLHAKYLNKLIKCCPKIKRLKLKEVNIRSGKFFSDLGIYLPHLTDLHLSHSHFLTPVHITNIAKKCNSLMRLWLSGEVCCGRSEDWEHAYSILFKQRWKTLTYLQFDASRLKDSAFKELSQCVNLKILHLHKAVNLFNEGLTAIGSLQNLLSLRLHKANHLCSGTLLTLFQSENMKNLVYFSIASSSCVTDECADSIATYCPRLHILSLAMVDGITDVGVEKLIKNCKYLHNLDLFWMKNVTGSCLSSISTHAKRLNYLIIEEMCSAEKEKFVQSLIKSDCEIKVHRTKTWKTGGLYKCKLL